MATIQIPYSGKVWQGEIWCIDSFQAFGYTNKLLIVILFLYGFYLATHRRFNKLSPHQTFPCIQVNTVIHNYSWLFD